MSRATRVPPDPHDASLVVAFRSAAEHSHPRSDCPHHERVWDAVRLQVPLEERLGIIDHLGECPTCAEAWSLAAELAAAERAANGEPTVQPQLQAPERRRVEMRAFLPLGSMFGRNALPIAMAVLLVLSLGAVFVVYRQLAVRIEVPPEATAAAPVPSAYRIKAVLNREQDGMKIPVEPFERLSSSVRLSMDIDISVPLYVYLVRGDQRGNSSLMFPSPDSGTRNPLPAGSHRLPDPDRDGKAFLEAAPGGGRQHLVVIASPTRAMLEEMFASMPRSPIRSPSTSDSKLSSNEPGKLRSLYGIVFPPAVTGGEPYADRWFHDPLPREEETAQGVWIHEATYEYPNAIGSPRTEEVTGVSPNEVQRASPPMPSRPK